MQRFVENLEKLAKDIHEMKQVHQTYTGSSQFSSDQCWICGILKDLAEIERVSDHRHASGKFLGFARSKCNIKRRTVIYIPIFAHNLPIYDLHFVCKNIHFFSEGSKIHVIPITDEKYISLSPGIRVGSYTDR